MTTQIPAPRVPIINERTGQMSREWYLFFLNLFDLTGSGSNNISLLDVQQDPSNPASSEIAELQKQINNEVFAWISVE